MKTKLRLTSILLVIILLASLLGCSMPGIGTDSGEGTEKKPAATVPEDIFLEETTSVDGVELETETEFLGPFTEPVPVTTPEPGYIADPIEFTVNFHGEAVKVLYGNDSERNEFEVNETGEIVDDAIYRRNVTVEEILNIKFEWKGMNALSSHANDYVYHAGAMTGAGEGFDIYAATRRAMAQLLTKGYLQDFNLIQDGYIDLSKPWYFTTAEREDLTIGGANFLAAGDISANAILQMNVIFYNVGFAESYGHKDIVSKVEEGKWTLDTLIELSKVAYVDFDGSGNKSDADLYGFTQAQYLDSDAFYSGSGLQFFKIDPTGDNFVLHSDDMTSQKAAELNKKLFAFFDAPSSYTGTPYSLDGKYTLPFVSGGAMFCHAVLASADVGGELSTLDFEYGILPIPKYDENQEQHVTTLSNQAVFWGINNYLEKERSLMSSAVIETMALRGYMEVTPALFEATMKMRFTSESKSKAADMFELIRDSVRIDVGRLFSETAYALPTLFANGVVTSADHWIISASNSQNRALIRRGESELNRSIEYAMQEQK